jgi:hypothetical protein
MKKAFGCVFVCVSLSSVLLASPSDHYYSLKRQPKVGETIDYHVEANFQFMGRTATMTMDQMNKVVKVDQQGAFDIETTPKECRFVADGKTKELSPGDATTACYDAFGCPIALDSTVKDDFTQRKANMLAFVAPEKQASVGSEWDKDWTADPDTKAEAAKSTYKFEAEEKVDGINAVRVAFTYTETSGDYPMSGEGHEWINKEDGSLVKVDARFKNFPMNGGTPVDGTLVMERKSR